MSPGLGEHASGAACDPGAATALLCDADDTLFPSEAPAYEASADVVNRFLAAVGETERYSPAQLRAMTNGKNFRAAALQLAQERGRTPDPAELDAWVAQERDVVTAHLREVLRPDPAVRGPLEALAGRLTLAAVTSSAAARLDACLEVTGLDDLFPPERRFSAEDSLPTPTSKPDPAVYAHALQQLGTPPEQAVAVEDSLNGARSAVAAGVTTIAFLHFVPATERRARRDALLLEGAVAAACSWAEVQSVLTPAAPTPWARAAARGARPRGSAG